MPGRDGRLVHHPSIEIKVPHEPGTRATAFGTSGPKLGPFKGSNNPAATNQRGQQGRLRIWM